MNEHRTSPADPAWEDRLMERLRAEVESDRPAFSPELHARLMRTVRQRQPARQTARRPRKSLWWLSAAAAVAAAVLAWFVARPANDPAPTTPRMAVVDPAPLPRVGPPTAAELTALVDATFAGPQWAYLDHDARLATQLVLNHIPFELSPDGTPTEPPTEN